MEWSSMIVLTFLFMPWGVPTSGLPWIIASHT